MDRRDFIKTSGVLGAMALTGTQFQSCNKIPDFSKLRGFNLLEKFGTWNGRQKFKEQDFEIMAEWGMNFARIPMSYWTWSSKEDWYKVDEEVLKDVDEVVKLGQQYRVHINLNMHRIPGYCINDRAEEPSDLFDDTPENMQKALDAAIFHWKLFAQRYKDVPNILLSYDLINEPPHMTDETRYVEIIKALVKAIHEEDPGRLIVADGKNVGRDPVLGIADMKLVQSARGYDPMNVSHYTATWIPKDMLESFVEPTWPLVDASGKIWDKAEIKKVIIDNWKPVVDKGVQVHVGEWGCYNKTPHDVALRWMRDLLSLWKEANWGHALWNLKGDFGILNSRRSDVQYENYKGHQLDRKMLELVREFNA